MTLTLTLTDAGKPQITWAAVSGATKYEVYRSTAPDSGFTKVNTTTGTRYINTSVTSGVKYYYKVVAICGRSSAGNSVFSDVVSVTIE